MYNGIELDNYTYEYNRNNANGLHLISIANIDFWHGYDRILYGMKNYYDSNNKIKVYFHIVGEGEELNNLKMIAERLSLNSKVTFYGNLDGKELDQIAKISDIGIGSIANHRKSLEKDSALKNREYCVRGIPFIISSDDDAFVNFKYLYKVPQDESPIDIVEIINFYNNIISTSNYKKEMIDYAMNNLSWDSVMEPIINYLNG